MGAELLKDAELLKALHEQYVSYLADIHAVLENLTTFLKQNKDFCSMFGISILVYITSLDLELSMKAHEPHNSTDIRIELGSRRHLLAMCDELRQSVAQ